MGFNLGLFWQNNGCMLSEFRRMQSDDFTGLDLPLNGDLVKVLNDGESLPGVVRRIAR